MHLKSADLIPDVVFRELAAFLDTSNVLSEHSSVLQEILVGYEEFCKATEEGVQLEI